MTTLNDTTVRRSIPVDDAQITELYDLCCADRYYRPRRMSGRAMRNAFDGVVVVTAHPQILGVMAFNCYFSNYTLEHLLVHPSCWNRGIGSKLLGYLIERLDSRCTFISAQVNRDNDTGYSFLKKRDFHCAGLVNERTYYMAYELEEGDE